MKTLLALEEIAVFAACIMAFAVGEWPWWWFPALLLAPDISMLGYAGGPKIGAGLYNLFHHRGTALLIGALGVVLPSPPLMLAGIILLAHISIDRSLGYGLKTTRGFRHTHLGDL